MSADPFKHDLATLTPQARAALARPASQFIDGAWHTSAQVLPVIDPSSGAQIAEIASGGADEVDAAVRAAKSALRNPEWAAIGPLARERLLHRLADLITAEAETIAQLETVDNGMPTWFAMGANVMGAADVWRYYAGWPSKLTGTTTQVQAPPGAGRHLGLTWREPVGVVGAIVPWNVPFMMAAWKLAPALAAGCTVVLKPAEDTSLSALYLADMAMRVGFPAGVINIVTGTGRSAGSALVAHPDVAKISFTGSTATGQMIGEVAGRTLKRVTLELGGKSPTLLFADADLDRAILGAANSIFFNAGQICVAGSRLFVQDQVYDQVVASLTAHIATLRIGAGLNPDVFLGPLASAVHRDRVQGFVSEAAASGLDVIRGAAVPDSPGSFFSPAIVLGAGDNDRITREEVFGPVLSVYRFSDADEAVARANASDYGLGATIWSSNAGQISRVAAALECGKVIVNSAGFPYAGLPEGGYKASGHGRDLGPDAVEQCLQTKSVLYAD